MPHKTMHRTGFRSRTTLSTGRWINGQKTPGNGRAQADVAVEVKRLFGVVPVLHLKQALHGPAGDVFQCGCADHAGQKNKEQVILERQGNPEHDDGPASV